MNRERMVSAEVRVFLNHMYEYKKGVRQLVLYTMRREHESFAATRLERNGIPFLIQTVGNDKINLFFGRKECLGAVGTFIDRPLNRLTPEEDFMLGAMLGYDICRQCMRFCDRKHGYKTGEKKCKGLEVL